MMCNESHQRSWNDRCLLGRFGLIGFRFVVPRDHAGGVVAFQIVR
jgi:hypothetical protein